MSENMRKLLERLTYKNELTEQQMQELYDYFECGYEIYEFLIEKYENDIFEFPCGYLKNDEVTICIYYSIKNDVLTLEDVEITLK